MDRPLPDQVTMGLLQYLNAHTLDEDYAVAARRRAGEPASGSGRVRVLAALVLAAFGVVVVTAAAQTSRATAESGERRSLITQVKERRDHLSDDRKRVLILQRETERLESQLLTRGGVGADVFKERELLGVRNGNIAVTGPGVRITVDNAPDAADDERKRVLDTDLQHVANGLWEAGAEAISINGERLGNLSAIRHAGDAITVNFRAISPPYKVDAIGDPDRLPARFGDTTSGQTWLDLQREIGLSFRMRVMDELELPAAPDRPLRYAEPIRHDDEEKVH